MTKNEMYALCKTESGKRKVLKWVNNQIRYAQDPHWIEGIIKLAKELGVL